MLDLAPPTYAILLKLAKIQPNKTNQGEHVTTPATTVPAADTLLKDNVRTWLREKGLRMAGPGVMYGLNGAKVTIRHVAMDWELSRLTGVAAHGVTEAQRRTAFEKVLIEDLESILKQTLDSVAYDAALVGDGTAELRKWVVGATGVTAPDTLDVYVAVMQHYIWQIKRKAKRLPVTYHLCPLLVGGQGTGKTTAVNRLNSPLNAFSIKGRPLDEITDPRNYLTLSENLIVFLDEMGRANRACVDHLKTIITADMVDYRPMRTNAIEKVEQSCTFIGASNKDTKLVISDNSGMRRFYELTCTEAAGSSDSHALVNGADITKIWRSINELQQPTYTHQYQQRINASQEDLRTKSALEEYLEFTAGAPGDIKVNATQLFESFDTFCANNNLFKQSSVIFFRELARDRGFQKSRNAKCTLYGVNEELNQYLTTGKNGIIIKRITTMEGDRK